MATGTAIAEDQKPTAGRRSAGWGDHCGVRWGNLHRCPPIRRCRSRTRPWEPTRGGADDCVELARPVQVGPSRGFSFKVFHRPGRPIISVKLANSPGPAGRNRKGWDRRVGSSTDSGASSLVTSTSICPTLAVVIVNYQSWDDVAQLVDLLAPGTAVRAGMGEILVVDNASGQSIPDSLRPAPPGVR